MIVSKQLALVVGYNFKIVNIRLLNRPLTQTDFSALTAQVKHIIHSVVYFLILLFYPWFCVHMFSHPSSEFERIEAFALGNRAPDILFPCMNTRTST